MFEEQGRNQRSAADQAKNARQDLINFRNAEVFKNSRDEAAKYTIKDASKLEDEIYKPEFQIAFSIWSSFLDTDADTLDRLKAAQPITDKFVNAIVNGRSKEGLAGVIANFFRGEASTGPFDSSNVKVLMTVNTPEGIVQLRNDARSKQIAELLLDGTPGYSVEEIEKVTAGGTQRGKTMSAAELSEFGDRLVPMLIGNAMIQGERVSKR